MANTNQSPSFKEEVKNALQQNLLALIRRPQQAQKETPRPKNKNRLALFGFNGTFFALDIVSGITVTLITSVAYGVLTFLAGFLALVLHEQLFTNAHANMRQKWIAIGGGTIAVLSTLSIGLLSGAANIFKLTDLVDITNIELAMIAFIVCTVFTHGILWGFYYFTDPTHVAEMQRMVNIAFRDQQKQGFAEAKADLTELKVLFSELESMNPEDRAALLETYKQNRGVDLFVPDPEEAATTVPTTVPAARQQPQVTIRAVPTSEPVAVPAPNNNGQHQQGNP